MSSDNSSNNSREITYTTRCVGGKLERTVKIGSEEFRVTAENCEQTQQQAEDYLNGKSSEPQSQPSQPQPRRRLFGIF